MAKQKRERKQAAAPKQALAEEFGNEFIETNASKEFNANERKAEKNNNNNQ
ncbi:hypothetical protein [Bacillus solimangrovi]|uniref:hypothetical protein n=1 Tax=Bacillus solimangrovi TaxID=1305675 RepID=UPI0015860E1D|nr:hypothetical protein [Bacillus solimangrovi]